MQSTRDILRDVAKTLFYGGPYLRAVGAEGQAWLVNASLVPVSIKGPTIFRPGEKIFKIKLLRKLENAILRLIFANTVFYKRAILVIF